MSDEFARIWIDDEGLHLSFAEGDFKASSSWLAEVKAEAWDEGYRSCFEERFAPNPYREETQ